MFRKYKILKNDANFVLIWIVRTSFISSEQYLISLMMTFEDLTMNFIHLVWWVLLLDFTDEKIMMKYSLLAPSLFYRDGQPNNRDNCPLIANADQADADDDDIGDECDGDIDDDGWRNDDDICPWV